MEQDLASQTQSLFASQTQCARYRRQNRQCQKDSRRKLVDLEHRVGAAHGNTRADEQQIGEEDAHSVPFVDGTPLTRGSGSTASRRARATALYSASVM